MPHQASDRPFDVIIIGARVAGSATALLLARAGLRVLVVDRQAYGSDTLSTHALMRGGVHLLSRWGLLTPLLAAGTPLVTTTTFHYGDEELAIPLRTDEIVPGLMAPRRTLLDATLVDAATAAGAVFLHCTALRGLVTDARERVAGISAEARDGSIRTYRAALVIGADGIGSAVARLTHAQQLQRGKHSAANIFGYLPGLGNSGFHWHYRPGLSAGVIPTGGGSSCVFASIPTQTFDAPGFRGDIPSAFRRVLAATDPGLAERIKDVPEGPLSVFRGRPGYLREAHGPGWALVGDAGFFRDPLTAHGITDALRDAEALAGAILRGTAYDMRRYQSERDALAIPLLETTDRIVAFDWDLATLQQLHINLNQTMKAEMAAISDRSVPAETAGSK